jgi:integrase
MTDPANSIAPTTGYAPWNKGKLIGAKPPLRPKHVWSIRTKLQVDGRIRDLALFNLAIDSKLRGCDVVALKVDDIAPNGYAVDRATVRQKKTGRPDQFELTEATRQAVDDYTRATGQKPGEYLFPGGGSRAQSDNPAICTSPRWVDREYRLGPAFIRDAFTTPNKGNADLSRTGNLRAMQLLLGRWSPVISGLGSGCWTPTLDRGNHR